jgi:NADPH-dependent curcumin reductase CurA
VADDFRLEDAEVPVPGDGEVVVAHSHLGLAPRARIRMSDDAAAAPDRMQLGEVVHSAVAGTVVASRHAGFPAGSAVASVVGGWQSHSVADGSLLTVIDTALAPPSVWMGTLGVSGFTAYLGVEEIGKPRAGETFVVSSAAGAVGLVAAQIASLRGARVVGIAGGPEKARHVEKHFRAQLCVDYRAADFAERLAAACPDGVDVYFDNVGGAVRDAVWTLMNHFGRIVVCGQTSQYVRTDVTAGPDWYPLLTRSLLVQGLAFAAYLHRYDEFVEEMGGWIRSGQVVSAEHVVHGLEATPAAFIDLLSGRHVGKVVVEL